MLVLLIVALQSTTALTGCAGYVEQPDGLNIKLNNLKIQLVHRETNKLLSETEVARSTGFFHVSFDKHAKVILRLVAPNGWIFEETEKYIDIDGKDKCSTNEDIIFFLKGFRYKGTITSTGSDVGPSDITVTLSDSTGSSYNTVTGAGGIFIVGPILPGSYLISAKHPLFSLSAPNQLELTTDCIIRKAPSVIGYQITGNVDENTKPVKNVKFALTKDGSLVSETTSNENGEFQFEKIAAGEYVIKASYVDTESGTVFTVEPAEQAIIVSIDNADLENNFKVTGINIVGSVLDIKGMPIADAKIIFDGQQLDNKSNVEGRFEILNVTPGKYMIHAEKADWEFEPMLIDVSSSNPSISPLTPSGVAVCPIVHYENVDIQVYQGQKLLQSSKTRPCFYLRQGSYTIIPVAIGEKVHFTPRSQIISVDAEPIRDGIVFNRYFGSFTAWVNCLGECGEKTAVVLQNEKEKFDVTLTTIENKIKIFHSGLNPDTYTLHVQNDNWCFDKISSIIMEVTIFPEHEELLREVEVSQTGYKVTVITDYAVEIDFDGERKDLNKGENNFCLNRMDTYKITPISCHKFEQAVYEYKMVNPVIMKIAKTSQSVKINLGGHTDETLELFYSISGGEYITLAPRYSGDYAVYDFLLSPADEVEILAKSSNLYIQPFKQTVSVPQVLDECLPPIIFEGLKGLFIYGQLEPPVAGIDVTLYNNDLEVESVKTLSTGKFTFGPMDPHDTYDVTLAHPDYRFQRKSPEGYVYLAHELAKVNIGIQNEQSEPSENVLVKISGPNRFRAVEKLDSSGTIQFSRLEPGEYYLTLEKKEYKFEPNHVELSLAGNRDLKIIAHRYQYSAIGRLSLLSNIGLENCVVEASGLQSSHCADHFEESVTESDGSFKILGLSQECTYTIKIKSDDLLISPSSRQIQIKNSDVTNIEFSAFKVISDTRISGNVAVCSHCTLRGISAAIYNVNDDNIRGAKIDQIDITEYTGTYFNFKKIERNNQRIEIEIAGPDDKQSYVLYADKPHKHYTFNYVHKNKDKVIPEKTQGQLGAAILILVILISTFVTKRDMILYHLSKTRSEERVERGTRRR